jgi:hypothetical protein
MSFDLVLTGVGGPFPFTFGSVTPFIDISHDYEHDDNEPPALTSITRRWSLTGILYGATESAVITAYDALKAATETRTNYPTGIELQRDSVKVDSIATADGDDGFKIVSLGAPSTSRQLYSELTFDIVIEGKTRVAASGIVALKCTDGYSYDERGLLTRTKTCDVETAAGTGAEAAARLQFLTLPSTSYAFTTNGPEGVDVTDINDADTFARSTSTYVQSGGVIPADVAPSYSLAVTTTTIANETTTTTRVNARGTGAEAAVDAAKPTANLVSESKSVDDAQRTATATYVTTTDAGLTTSNGLSRISRIISTSGGGHGVTHSLMSGGRLPIRHILARTPVTIVERVGVETLGAAPVSAFVFPEPLDFHEDVRRRVIQWPIRAQGSTTQGDRWVASITRVYEEAELDASKFTMSLLRGDNPATPIQNAAKKGVSASSDVGSRPMNQPGRINVGAAGRTLGGSVATTTTTPAVIRFTPFVAGGELTTDPVARMKQFAPFITRAAPPPDASFGPLLGGDTI